VEKCVACQYYDRDDKHAADKGVSWGKCRRTGPIVHPVSVKSYMVEGVWPHVRDDDWCGEWAPAKHRVEAAATDSRTPLLMQAAAASARPSGGLFAAASRPDVPLGAALMSSAAPAAETTAPPVTGRFGSN
jgi:hypothetical protein